MQGQLLMDSVLGEATLSGLQKAASVLLCPHVVESKMEIALAIVRFFIRILNASWKLYICDLI